jgi:uncharacterized protein (TIGR02996 family)
VPKNEALWQEVVTSRADAARVAYARWLTSQGAQDRARLIELQLEIANGLATGSAQAWVNSARPERDARALLRRNLPAWKTEERHDTAFYWKGFPARVVVTAAMKSNEVGAKLRALPVEHVVLRGVSSPAVFDELAARGVRAITIAGSHVQLATAVMKHALVHQVVWLRAHEARLDRAFWDSFEKAAPNALLYVDADRGLAIEEEDASEGEPMISVDAATLERPCWRCPCTTWGPRPTLTRVLACADAIRAGRMKKPRPGMFSYEVNRVRDVERPPKTFDEVVAPETWDPEKE